MSRKSGFTLTELVTSFVLLLLFIGFSHAIIGCGGGPEEDLLSTMTEAEKKRIADMSPQQRKEFDTMNEAFKKMTPEQRKVMRESLVSARRTARRMQNSTQVRGIGMGLILYAQGNNDWYPGLTAAGELDKRPLAADATTWGTKAVGGEPAYAYTIMLRGNYFTPEYTISPAETANKTMAKVGSEVTSDNFSYAFLRIDQKGAARTGEWRGTTNSRSVVVTDRNLASGAGPAARSIHNADDNDAKAWLGSVLYNDNHVNFEVTNTIKTEYSQQGETLADDLFADDKSSTGKDHADAAMVYQDGTTYVNQK